MTEDRWQLMFALSPGKLLSLLTTTAPDILVRTENGVPADARFIRALVDDYTQEVLVVLEHPSFKAKYEAQGVIGWADGLPTLRVAAPHTTAYCGPEVRNVLNASEG